MRCNTSAPWHTDTELLPIEVSTPTALELIVTIDKSLFKAYSLQPSKLHESICGVTANTICVGNKELIQSIESFTVIQLYDRKTSSRAANKWHNKRLVTALTCHYFKEASFSSFNKFTKFRESLTSEGRSSFLWKQNKKLCMLCTQILPPKSHNFSFNR